MNETPAKKSKLRRYIVTGLITLFVLALLGGTGFMLFMKIKFADFQPPMEPANVILSPVVPYEFKDTIEAIGTITASESATITATVTETIKAINAQEGQFVAKGTSIVDLISDQEQATLDQASKSYGRYNQLVKNNLASAEKRDEEQASFNVAKAQLDKRKIVAPFDGFLGIRHVNVGDVVQPGTVITTIDAIDPIKLDFAVPEVYLAALKQDMPIEATSAAWPDTVFKGKIYVVDSRIDTDSRAIMVRAIMENPDHKLKPGLLMKVQIIRDVKTSLAIPESAIQSAGQKKSVFVVGADKKVAEKVIQTGQREPGVVEVTSGLVAGDKVIIEGQMKTGDGATVHIASEKTLQDIVQDDAGYSIPRKQDSLRNDFKITPKDPAAATTEPVTTDGQAK
ncbi:MAG TPA: efflux transporter periplasmic adaptor subunit [Rhodospirillaceae bacterium]|nr:efflux transporter periplasmic adaptor subunit [Rhodospirillaceae bacterium]